MKDKIFIVFMVASIVFLAAFFLFESRPVISVATASNGNGTSTAVNRSVQYNTWLTEVGMMRIMAWDAAFKATGRARDRMYGCGWGGCEKDER